MNRVANRIEQQEQGMRTNPIRRLPRSIARLGQWQPLYKQGIENFRRLVYAFYEPGFSFATFLREHPQYHSNLVDILVGDVFKPGVGDMFSAMGSQPD